MPEKKGTKNPLVSIVMITYNQDKYIQKAIDSILSQQTVFKYEVIIGEDCSTDKTRDICIDYSTKYPDKIRLLLHDNNIGMYQNFLESMKLTKGKYIAICEGDDFWTNPEKLQMQYNFLEKNPDFAGIHTKVDYIDKNGCKTGISNLMPENTSSINFNYLLQKNVICTCSFMFRRSILDNTVLSLLKQTPIQDYTLFLATALKGNIYYLDKVTAAYRRSFGVTANWIFSETKRKHLIIYSLFEKHYNLKKHRRALYAAKQYHYYHSIRSTNRLQKGPHLARLLWYSLLTSLCHPKIRVYKIPFRDIVKAIYRNKPKLRNWLK
jgi:glycosyltransferase involved in cell wall biosynthesis